MKSRLEVLQKLAIPVGADKWVEFMPRKLSEDQSELVDPRVAKERLLLMVRTECSRKPTSHGVLVYVAKTDEVARRDGWPSAKAMKEHTEEALRTLPMELQLRVFLTEY